ncbi:hypothetical protein [Thiobacillus sp.]
MKQSDQPIRTKRLAGIVFATAVTAVGVGVGVNANADAGTQVAAPGNIQAGDAADAHINAYVSAYTAAQRQSRATRDAERMGSNNDGLEQSTAAEPEAAGKAAAKAKRSGTR